MADAVLIQPDAAFIKDVLASGGGDLKKCFQCATCSTICKLSPEGAPFPRKQILAAQWGLKDKVVGDPAIWLCHNCGDCTAYCPRGARPGDILGALRHAAIREFAFPRVLGKIVATPKGLPLLYLIPAVIFLAIAFLAPRGEVNPNALEFGNVFPIYALEGLFFAVSALVALVFIVGIVRFTKALKAEGASGSVMAGLVPALKEILAHRRFNKCGEERDRYMGHLLTFWGFMALAFVG
ncbi:MAG: 4Fe-4S dicluster domain-containing protein, partial [Acidobacteria bacterium]|nr:4Fe-4S dicluster domain-containing protein [Acidobacteriota bacterium]